MSCQCQSQTVVVYGTIISPQPESYIRVISEKKIRDCSAAFSREHTRISNAMSAHGNMISELSKVRFS